MSEESTTPRSLSETPSSSDPCTSTVTATKKRNNRKRKRRNNNDGGSDTVTSTWHTPWLESLGMTEYESKEQRLHDEIVAYVSYVEPTDAENKARELLIARIGDVIRRRFSSPSSSVRTFGSVEYNLCLPDGDIDMVIYTPQIYEESYKTRVLFQLASMLRKAQLTLGGQVAVGARVPILSLTTVAGLGSYDVDISINTDDGVNMLPIIRGYLSKMPALKPLVMLIKGFLSGRALQSAAKGGLGSYATLCMLICFLQLNPRRRPQEFFEKPMETESLGTLLLDFFDYFGNEFPYRTSYIATTQGKILPKESIGWVNESHPDALSITCLLNPGRDIGKAASKIAQVRIAFQEAYNALQNYCFNFDHFNVLGSVVTLSEKTLNRRKHIEHLVTSGNFESDISSIVLPPLWTPRPKTSTNYRSDNIHRHRNISGLSYHNNAVYNHHPTYAGGYAGGNRTSAYPNGWPGVPLSSSSSTSTATVSHHRSPRPTDTYNSGSASGNRHDRYPLPGSEPSHIAKRPKIS
ncbi:hypothetical protein C8Q75DRAFT_807149 [Abortiporus biennis]|nr:hypothetical protein C8Q75DRAFT_807149 [Abortiporus biennis]